MRLERIITRRRAATAVEFAVVGSITFFLLLALAVGGMGTFRYQEVAHLAREGSRFASTHAGQYHLDGNDEQSGVPQILTSDDLRNHLKSKLVSLDPAQLTVTIAWSPPPGQTPVNMPYYADVDPNLVPPGQKVVNNYVTTTVTYQWTPVLYLVGPIALTSTSTVQVAY